MAKYKVTFGTIKFSTGGGDKPIKDTFYNVGDEVDLDPADPIVVNQHLVMTHGPHPEYQLTPVYPAQYVTQVVPAADFKGPTPAFVQTAWPGAPGTMPKAPAPTVAAPLVGTPGRSTVKADAK